MQVKRLLYFFNMCFTYILITDLSLYLLSYLLHQYTLHFKPLRREQHVNLEEKRPVGLIVYFLDILVLGVTATMFVIVDEYVEIADVSIF